MPSLLGVRCSNDGGGAGLMHRYDHHIGDYDRDTGHLSLLEHGVYRRLLDRMYADERPLPVDLAKVGRKLGVRTKPEREALEVVIEEFFERRDSGFHHRRVERELGQIETRMLQSQYGMVKRYWKPSEMGPEPTFEQFREHPEWYRDPTTGHIGCYYRNGSGLSGDKDGGNTYHRPPTTDHRPPTTDHVGMSTPLPPDGGDGEGEGSGSRELELSASNGLRPGSQTPATGAQGELEDSKLNGSAKKKKGGAGKEGEVLTWSEAEGWRGVTLDLVGELGEAYPACDIRRQFLAMEQWLKANRERARKQNWRRFVNNWLRREQERGGDLRYTGGAKKESGAAGSDDAFLSTIGGGR
jgi:hypothetical protein